MRPAQVILDEKVAAGKALEYVRALAVAIGHAELRALAERLIAERDAAKAA